MAENEGLVLERTYRASVQDVWALWTTRDGFTSWWGPEGFRVEVQELDPRLGGTLRYDMIADRADVIAQLRASGEPLSHPTRGRFTELQPQRRLALTHLIDFLPGVPPYDNTMVVELFPSGDRVRMVVTLSALHDPAFTRMQREGFTSQLTKLDGRWDPA